MDSRRFEEGWGRIYQPPPELELLEEDVLELELPLDVDEAVSSTSAQRLWYQLVMLAYPAVSAVHASSHTPAVVVEKAVNLESEQKQAS